MAPGSSKRKPAAAGHKPHSHNKPRRPLRSLSSSEHISVSCRFVLKASSSLTPSSIDVEKAIPPNQVWRVFSPVQECPICLERAEVPRMLSCGHIMCMNCMRQHRLLSESPNCCAICGEPASHHLANTLAVSFLESEPGLMPREGEEIVLTLVKRNSHSVVALPVNLDSDSLLNNTAQFPGPECILYTRLCRGTLDYATRELAQDLKSLVLAKNRCISEYGSDEGHTGTISEMKTYISSLKNSETSSSNQHNQHNQQSHHNQNHNHPNNQHQSSNSTSSNINSGQHMYSYYYQVAFESQTFYTLGSLDMSILRAGFGSYESLPTSVIAKVENIEHGVMDHTNDSRQKYLRHIPEQTPVAYVECDWTGVVPDEVLTQFKTKINERHERKVRKTAKDILEKERAAEAIETQFKIEVAEALTPHSSANASHANINTSILPSLAKHSSKAPSSSENRPIWVDHDRENEEVLKNSYVTGKGKKKIVLRF